MGDAAKNLVRGLALFSLFLLVGCNGKEPADTSQVLDLNAATAAELETLPGVGAVIAERIVKARPFASVEELLKVPGIDEQALQEIKPRVK